MVELMDHIAQAAGIPMEEAARHAVSLDRPAAWPTTQPNKAMLALLLTLTLVTGLVDATT